MEKNIFQDSPEERILEENFMSPTFMLYQDKEYASKSPKFRYENTGDSKSSSNQSSVFLNKSKQKKNTQKRKGKSPIL